MRRVGRFIYVDKKISKILFDKLDKLGYIIIFK